MSNLTVTINGSEYAMATTLRVAYKIQGQHHHAPYTEVFQKVGEMTVEDQIGILYAAFQCANPNSPITRQAFQDCYLDNYNLKALMAHINAVIKGVMGEPEHAEEAQASGSSEDVEGN